ncbi:MAG: type III pantothenate kinase, partial [Oscillospiraceae bacterium]|nr:type III pantothenate kinase [Oscillospiraceae bacterium]
MILAIDIGNTNIVVGCIEGETISCIDRIHTDATETSTEYAIKLLQLLAYRGIDRYAFEGAIISSVVPQLSEAFRVAIQNITGKTPLVVGPGMKTGMNVRLDDPGTLAGDLVVGSVAAIQYYGAPCIVLDMGTASTIVLIDKDNCYRGGAILPGVRLGLKALAEGTSLLPDISLTAPKKCISTNTVDCMRSGAIFGNAAMIDGMIDRMEAEIGYPCKVIATGGLAATVTQYCRRSIICDDDLLLKGLWYLYKRNTK